MGKENECVTELCLPQLCLRVDIKTDRNIKTEVFIRQISRFFGVKYEAILISKDKERILSPERTFKDEGIRTGERLVYVYITG
ncbi:MAG: hypothetical protein K6B28_12855 [Lachnospiraceae bacterium]|nr:hypothetical protein [Lachnospiraceae bacterium]